MLSIIGKRYTLNILRNLMYSDSMRFNELAKEIAGSPKTLTERLNELVDLQIVKREAFAEIPPRVEYSLTERGKDLEPVMESLRIWVEKWWLGTGFMPYISKPR
jgi:DNA-binding HxlR family transcriptional regulator